MKKIFKRLLIGLTALVLLLVLIGIGFRLFGPEPEYFLTEEECAERVVGTWVEPFGIYATHTFHADGTGDLGGIPVTWEISKRSNAENSVDYDWFVVECRTEENDNLYTVHFTYLADIDYTYADPYYISDSKGIEGRGGENALYESSGITSTGLHRFKQDTVEVIYLDENNWNDYFAIDCNDSWIEVNGNTTCSFRNYIVLKPEYSARLLTANNKDFTYSCSYEITTTPYNLIVDEETQAITLGDIYTESEKQTLSYSTTESLYSLNYEQDFGYTLDYIFVADSNFPDMDHFEQVVTDYTLTHAEGILLLGIPGPLANNK